MTQQLNIHETKTQLSKLIELTQAGEEFVIAKAGKPVAKLVPLDKARPPRKLGLLDGKISISEDYDAPLPDEVLAEFEGGAPDARGPRERGVLQRRESLGNRDKDPLDRILVAQSRVEPMILLTNDGSLVRYWDGVRLVQ